ncbi:hypothetical protein JCGZ_26706 [Jatropha curcas]|uniref:Uncharacterized protein n=1 Tax=Jatropha curcas TaxID=180498 RepID=A0A067JXK1_JATCU|nr:hypothetical protein JCGZ_26706 [Jatropha curcas]
MSNVWLVEISPKNLKRKGGRKEKAKPKLKQKKGGGLVLRDEDDENEKTPPLPGMGLSTPIPATSLNLATLDQAKLPKSVTSSNKVMDPFTLFAVPSEEVEVVHFTAEDDLPLARRKKRTWTEPPKETARLKPACLDAEGYIKAIHGASGSCSQSLVSRDLAWLSLLSQDWNHVDSTEESAIFDSMNCNLFSISIILLFFSFSF